MYSRGYLLTFPERTLRNDVHIGHVRNCPRSDFLPNIYMGDLNVNVNVYGSLTRQWQGQWFHIRRAQSIFRFDFITVFGRLHGMNFNFSYPGNFFDNLVVTTVKSDTEVLPKTWFFCVACTILSPWEINKKLYFWQLSNMTVRSSTFLVLKVKCRNIPRCN